MANLERVVNVDISLNTTGVSKDGFSTLLIVGTHSVSATRVLTYTSVDSMLEDGFDYTDPLYIAANDAFSQIPKPKYVKIGRRLPAGYDIAVNAVKEDVEYRLTIKGKETSYNYTYAAAKGDTESTILQGIASAVDADTSRVISVALNTAQSSLHIEAKNDDEFSVTVTKYFTLDVNASTESIADTMAAIIKSDNDFYGIALASRTQADILAMAAWTEGHRKLFGTAIAEVGAYNSESVSDTMYLLMNNNYYRTFCFYHEDAENDYPECAVFARCFSINPGGETWALKKLSGVVTDNLTETQYIAIKGKNGNTFEKFRNVSITQGGKVAAGEWIDVIRFRDWLQEEMTVNIFNLLINSDKVPYTDEGIAMIEARMRQTLDLGVQRGGIAPIEYDTEGNANQSYSITVPLSSDISANTKASRILEDVYFTARLAGAIHVVDVKGYLTYDNLISVE